MHLFKLYCTKTNMCTATRPLQHSILEDNDRLYQCNYKFYVHIYLVIAGSFQICTNRLTVLGKSIN